MCKLSTASFINDHAVHGYKPLLEAKITKILTSLEIVAVLVV